MSEIIFEQVNNYEYEYCWAKQGDFKVLIMEENGYINATKLCKDGGKSFKRWNESQESKDIINEAKIRLGIDVDILRMDVSNEIRGTYIHPDIIANLASWISSSFLTKTVKITNEYCIMKEREKYDNIIKQKDNEIEEREDKISKLKAKIDALNQNNEDLSDAMTKLSLDNEITHEQLNEVQHTLDIVVEDRVPLPADDSVTNTIVIYEVEKDANKFHIFRVQKRGFRAALTRYLKKSPNAVKFMEIEYNPNAINYYYRFKQEYKEKIISRYNDFELINTSKEQLKEFIEKVDDEKFEVENIK